MVELMFASDSFLVDAPLMMYDVPESGVLLVWKQYDAVRRYGKWWRWLGSRPQSLCCTLCGLVAPLTCSQQSVPRSAAGG